MKFFKPNKMLNKLNQFWSDFWIAGNFFGYVVLALMALFLPVSANAQSINDFKIIGYDSITDLGSAIISFLLDLAPIVAGLVIVWGGYQYFFGGLDGKSDGLNAIKSGVIGLAIVLSADFIISTVQSTFTGGGIESAPIQEIIINVTKALTSLASFVAILVIVWGGYQYFAGGFDGKKDGMENIRKGVIGLAVVLLANFIVSFVESILKNTDDLASVPEAIGKALEPVIVNITTSLSGLAGLVCILVITWGGYQYFFGGFDDKKEGMENIRKGVIGLVVVLLANFIASLTESFFKDIQKAEDFAKIPDAAESVLRPVLENGVDFLTALAGIASVLVIMWGGYKYFFSSLPSQQADGKETISKGVIGLIVTLLAKPIVQIVKGTIGVQNSNLKLNNESILYTVQTLISNILIPLSSVLTVFFLVLGAYQWITSNGDSGKVSKGQENIRNAVIGLIIVLIATSAVQLIILFLNNQPTITNQAPTEIKV